MAVAKKPKRIAETLKEKFTGADQLRFGLSKRRIYSTRCVRCLFKVRVTGGIMMRIALGESVVICGQCLGNPGTPQEFAYYAEDQGDTGDGDEDRLRRYTL